MRDGKLDFYKGLLIWSVVLGHTLNALTPTENNLHSVLRTFDLPMFMYISGFLLKGSIARHDWRQLILNKFTNIIVPALIWMCISLMFGDRCMYYFLWAVFFSSLIVCVCEKICPKSWMCMASVCLVAVAFHLIPKNIVNMSFLFPFFLLGYFTKNIVQVGWKKGWISMFLFVLLFVFVWKSDYSIWNSGAYILRDTEFILEAIIVRLAIGVAGIIFATYLFGFLYDRFKEHTLTRLFVGIGKETLSLYLLQHIIVEILLPWLVGWLALDDYLADNHLFAGYVLSPLISLLLLFLMYGIVNIIQKSEYTKWVFGFRIVISSKKPNH